MTLSIHPVVTNGGVKEADTAAAGQTLEPLRKCLRGTLEGPCQ